MAEPKQILVDNLRETLKAAQISLLSGNGTALFLLLLASRGQLATNAVEQEVKVPFADLSAPTFTAALIILVIYFISGYTALSFVQHVKRIKNELRKLDETELANAALTYPSMLTMGKIVPGLAALMPALLGIGALIASFYVSQGFSKALVTAMVFSFQYFILALWLWRSPLTE